jgi:hypothetical protein
MKKELFVPFDRAGNLLDYSYMGISKEEEEICKRDGKIEHFWGRDNALREVFVPNVEFEDTLIFKHFSRGRSSVKAHFESQFTGKKYEMFICDLEDVIKANYFITKLSGRFTFVKRGKNYGVMLLKGGE